MIIKTGTIAAGDALRITSYAQDQRGNETVELIQGSADELLVADEFAELRGHKNGLLHIIINPIQELTADQLAETVEAINQEFGFDSNDPLLLTKHQGKRANGTTQDHYHMVRPAADTDGKVYKMFRSKMKDEAISRLLELQFGHQITSGAHNKFAHMRLQEMGRDDLAEQLAPLLNEKPRAAFDHQEHRLATRRGFNLPALRQSLMELSELPRYQQPQKLAELIDQQGLELADAVVEGRGRSRINLKLGEGIRDHNANRTLKIKATEVAAFIHETREELHAIRSHTPKSRPDLDKGFAIADNRRSKPTSREQPSSGSPLERIAEGHSGDHQKLSSEAAELAHAAVELKSQAKSFSTARADDLTSLDIDAPPDLNDPNLMIKLAMILKKQMKKNASMVRKMQRSDGPAPGM